MVVLSTPRLTPPVRRHAPPGNRSIQVFFARARACQFLFSPHLNESNEDLAHQRDGYKRLNVQVAAVRIVAGEKSRIKRVSIMGVTRAQAIKALGL
jgi:urease beta subunit